MQLLRQARLAFLMALLIYGGAMLQQEAVAQAKKKVERPELAAIEDVAGLPRVLLVGDTVSISYTLPTRKLLEGKVNLHRLPFNAGASRLGAEALDSWLGVKPWDLIYFNYGAFDLTLGADGKPVTTLADYERNLRLIVTKLQVQAPTARLVFATTTPIPATAKTFASDQADAYSRVARAVMTELGVRIHDLHSVVQPTLAQVQIPNNIHFRPEGVEVLASQVATEITHVLQLPPPPPMQREGNGLRVFTAGHSFHIWVASILSELAKSADIKGHQIAGMSRIGGSTVLRHWDVPDDTNPTKHALRQQKCDVLTLSPIWLPDEGIENFAKLTASVSPKTRITVQEYWLPNDEYEPVYPLQTRKKVDHNAVNLAELKAAHLRYNHDLETHVRSINQQLGRDVMEIVPVGLAVVALREKIVAGQAPGIKTQAELFTDSWGHVHPPVQALSGYCHYAVIYRRSPVGLPRPTILQRNPEWNDDLNRLLQELAWQAVTQHPMTGVKTGP